ncbi:MAG: hypothetical protein PHW63_10645 [Alphaproteobacteria bacterium]|nr:hypothetical protein [Alphaproteobacteria bacterium]
MAKTNLNIRSNPDWIDIEDHRWHKNAHGMDFSGQNGVLIIDADIKAEGAHRVGRYLKSGVPLYRDVDDNLRLFTAAAKTAGKRVVGFLQTIEEVADTNGVYYDQKIVGIQTAGEIYPLWLPVQIADEDIPVRFGRSVL